jgi:hypothetical protein
MDMNHQISWQSQLQLEEPEESLEPVSLGLLLITCFTAVSNTSFKPFLVKALHSRYV